MFLFFEGFQPQNVLILFLNFVKHSYLLTDVEYFNTTFEEYLDGISDYITKDECDGAQVILL